MSVCSSPKWCLIYSVELCVFVKGPIKQVDGHNAYACKTLKNIYN